MSLFPFIDGTQIDTTIVKQDLPLAQEYAVDYDNNRLLLIDGKTQIVTGAEAVKAWAWKALKIQRYRYLAYSWNYGHDLENLIGIGESIEYVTSEASRYIQEALQPNPYIEAVTNIVVTYTGDQLSISFTLQTPYGEVDLTI